MSHGKAVQGPKPSQIVINPYDPKIGAKQTITIDVKYETAIASGSITMETDEKTKKYALKKISGTNTQGVWETTITTDDTHDYIYNVAIEFVGADKQIFHGKLTLRAQ